MKLLPTSLCLLTLSCGLIPVQAVAQQVQTGFTIGVSSQISTSNSSSVDLTTNQNNGFGISGSNVQTTDNSNILNKDSIFVIRDPNKPFSLVLDESLGAGTRVINSDSSAFSQGSSTSITVFSSIQ